MDVTLYKNFSSYNVLTKNISQVAKYEAVQLVDGTDDYDVGIRMTIPTDTLKWDNVNYMEWDGAYYFVESVQKVRNNVTMLLGNMDLLMTYRTAILQINGNYDRSTNLGSRRLVDENRMFSSDTDRTVTLFPNQIVDTEEMGAYIIVTSQSGYQT